MGVVWDGLLIEWRLADGAMGRADLLVGAGGLNLLLAILLAAAALWIGRRDTAMIHCAARMAPLTAEGALSGLPKWKLAVLALRRILLPAEVALFGLILGWGGLAAGVAAALGLWGFSVARARRILYAGAVGDPLDKGYRGFATRALVEAGLVAAAYAAAFSSTIFLALVT